MGKGDGAILRAEQNNSPLIVNRSSPASPPRLVHIVGRLEGGQKSAKSERVSSCDGHMIPVERVRFAPSKTASVQLGASVSRDRPATGDRGVGAGEEGSAALALGAKCRAVLLLHC